MRAAAKETLDLAIQAMEAKQMGIALSLEKSDAMITSVANAIAAGGKLNDVVNSLGFDIPGLMYLVKDKLGASVESMVSSHLRSIQSMFQRAFGALSPEAKFHLISKDPRMSKAIANDYFNAAYGRKREAPKLS